MQKEKKKNSFKKEIHCDINATIYLLLIYTGTINGTVPVFNVNKKLRQMLLSFALAYSGPCDLRPLHLTTPSILRPAISDLILIYVT